MSKQSTRMTRKTVSQRPLVNLSVIIPTQSLESSSVSENAPSTSASSFEKTNNNKKRKRESGSDQVMDFVEELEQSCLSNPRRRSSRFAEDDLCTDVQSPINKGKGGERIPSRPIGSDDDVEEGHHEILSHIPFMRLLRLVDWALKCEPTGCFYDSYWNIVTRSIKELSLLENIKDVESTIRFRTHNIVHTKEYAGFLTGSEPLCELIPVLVYYIRAKGLDRLSNRIVTQLRELFIKRLKSIAATPHLKKRRIFSGKKRFHMSDWTIYNNADYEENDVNYDPELVKKGHTFWLREYDDHSDYYEEDEE